MLLTNDTHKTPFVSIRFAGLWGNQGGVLGAESIHRWITTDTLFYINT